LSEQWGSSFNFINPETNESVVDEYDEIKSYMDESTYKIEKSILKNVKRIAVKIFYKKNVPFEYYDREECYTSESLSKNIIKKLSKRNILYAHMD
jgi:hypothetical protein